MGSTVNLIRLFSLLGLIYIVNKQLEDYYINDVASISRIFSMFKLLSLNIKVFGSRLGPNVCVDLGPIRFEYRMDLAP